MDMLGETHHATELQGPRVPERRSVAATAPAMARVDVKATETEAAAEMPTEGVTEAATAKEAQEASAKAPDPHRRTLRPQPD